MSEESALAFCKLVAAMRTTEKKYWETRDKRLLRQSIELEKRVDGVIMAANGNDVPENENGKFFLGVAQLRVSTKEYFSAKKEYPPDKVRVNELFQQVKEWERKVDKKLEYFQDEQARKDGFVIQWHVMERRFNQEEAHSIFSSSDEHLAKIELDDYLRRAHHGTMYFLAKKQFKPSDLHGK